MSTKASSTKSAVTDVSKTSPPPQEDASHLPVASRTRSASTSSAKESPQTRSMGLPTPLKIKVSTQRQRVRLLMTTLTDLAVTKDWTAQELARILEHVQEIHQAFSKTHTHFEAAWPEACLDHPYFSDSVFLEEHCLYQSITTKLGCLATIVDPQSVSSLTQSTQSRPRLPDIAIPTFAGDYSQWPAFRDLFKSLVIDAEQLADIERLHYLRTCLSHEPLETISSLPLTASSFSIAWQKLAQKYENRRLLLSSQYSRLLSFSLADQKAANASAIRQLCDSITNPLQCLSALGENLQQNNNLLVFHIINRLDHASRTQWESLISTHMEFPTLPQVMDFLESRSRSLDWVESTQRQPPQAVSKPRSGVPDPSKKNISVRTPLAVSSTEQVSSSSTTPIRSSSLPSFNCDDCGQEHFISNCPRFANRSPQQKADVVLHRVLCTNCLGRHNRRSCKTSKRCKSCGSQHHTLLHDVPLSSKPFSRIPIVPPRMVTSSSTSHQSPQKEVSPSTSTKRR